MQESWIRFLSFALLVLFALPVESLPKRKNNAATKGNNSATKGNGAATGAAAGGVAATAITQATDGSTILDKTVQIK